jgi:hypothetical protein
MTDWSQQDATKEQIEAWLRQHAGEYDSAILLAWVAHEHFCRPFHINVLQDMARKAFDEREAP